MTKKQRSRSNPTWDIREASDAIERVQNVLGSGTHSKEDLAKVFNYRNASSGTFGRKIAALCQYSLLQKEEDGYSVSQLAEDYLEALDEGDEAKAVTFLQKAFLNVPVFDEVVKKFQGTGQLPHDLENHLTFNFGITENASEEVASILQEGAFQCGLTDEEGRFRHSRDKLEADDSLQTFYITENKYILIPASLNLVDIKVIRTYLDAVEMALNHSNPSTLPFPRRAAGGRKA